MNYSDWQEAYDNRQPASYFEDEDYYNEEETEDEDDYNEDEDE